MHWIKRLADLFKGSRLWRWLFKLRPHETIQAMPFGTIIPSSAADLAIANYQLEHPGEQWGFEFSVEAIQAVLNVSGAVNVHLLLGIDEEEKLGLNVYPVDAEGNRILIPSPTNPAARGGVEPEDEEPGGGVLNKSGAIPPNGG